VTRREDGRDTAWRDHIPVRRTKAYVCVSPYMDLPFHQLRGSTTTRSTHQGMSSEPVPDPVGIDKVRASCEDQRA
jgi:hypothetical protein